MPIKNNAIAIDRLIPLWLFQCIFLLLFSQSVTAQTGEDKIEITPFRGLKILQLKETT